MRKAINLCFVLLAIAAVIYGLIGRYSNHKTIKESHVMELVKGKPQNHDFALDSDEEEATPR
jgi:hypothetical protein|tara:strand:- start:5737 stop:5922 length:186 start_codon:yes stop_codon:yes gene_type:complete